MNTIETATIIQSELDKAAVEQATSGWMEVNEKLVKYTGGAEVWCYLENIRFRIIFITACSQHGKDEKCQQCS